MSGYSFTSALTLVVMLMVISLQVNEAQSVAVMSIDLGSEFMKIAIVKPGVPMEIVLNKESRRKTPLAVSLRRGEREFGEMALQQSIKHPKSAYLYLTDILGKSLDNPAVVSYREKYPFYDIKEDPVTKTIYFQHDETTTYTPEELLGMIFEYARELAADFGEQAIDAAVITVPPYYNQAERKAILRAADLVNLKVLQLINTNAAAGLNYGVFRRKDFNNTGTTLMFFDMGSSSVTATIATFQLIKYKDDYEANPQMTIRGVGFDRELGGNQFTYRLAKHLAKLFYEKTKKDVFTNPKAIMKLYKEADRVKSVLSANADHFAQVEGLMDDVDFKAKVTREDLMTLCSDLFDRIKKPINDAIKAAEILPEEISNVILVGGGTRIPRIQEELLKATQKKELGKNLNTDEAPALGAVYQAAYQSKGYKVKKFYIKDANMYPLVVNFERFAGEGETRDPKNVVKRVLFDRVNSFPQKKVMTFAKHNYDFDFDVAYGEMGFLDERNIQILGTNNVSHITLKNVKEIFEKHQDEESKGIKAHFRVDDSGLINLDKVDVSFEKSLKPKSNSNEESTFSKLGNKISSFFSADSTGENKEGEENKATPSPTVQASNETLNATVQANNSTLTPNITITREEINFDYIEPDYAAYEKKRFETSRVKLQTIKEKEKEKRKRAQAINSLEAFIFDTKDKLTQDEFVKCTTEEEREKIRAKLDEADMWMSDADDTVETKAFSDKLNDLKTLCKDAFFRLSEKRLRPIKLDEMKDMFNKTTEFLNNARNLTGEDLPLTQNEWNSLDKLISTTKEWRVKMLNEQAKLADHEQPKLLTIDIHNKMEELKREVNYLLTKIKYFRPKTTKKPEPEPPKKSSNSTDSADQKSKDKEESTTNKKEEENGKSEDKSSSENEEFQNYEDPRFKDIFDKDNQEETTTTTETITTANPEL